MANRFVTLLVRVIFSPNNRPYLDPATTPNRTVSHLWAIHKGNPAHFPRGSCYYLRYKQGIELLLRRIERRP